MPCNIGYKSYARVQIPAPQAKKFKSRAKAPKVDAELMARLGQIDPVFVEWMNELDIAPLLNEALQRALIKVGGDGVEFSVADNGDLIAKAEYKSDRARKKIEQVTAAVSARWQMEVLGVIAQLLGFAFVIEGKGADSFSLTGEKHNASGVHEYLHVENTPDGAGLRFEHYRSPSELAADKDKFLALAQKFGVKITVIDSEDGGSPIPAGTVHRHFLKH